MTRSSSAREIAENLLDIRAVTFSPDSPFTWASGLKSPVYCDNRLTISYPRIRDRICGGFQVVLEENRVEPDVIIGTATAGIPHAAWLSAALDLPMAYVRSKPKGHGTASLIEGRVDQGARAVVVEDLVSTGRSSAGVVKALRAENLDVALVLAIFSYELDDAQETFKDLKVPLETLTSFDALFAAASVRNEISDRTIRSIREWRSDPIGWSERHG